MWLITAGQGNSRSVARFVAWVHFELDLKGIDMFEHSVVSSEVI
jgi:hypothetical protein